MTRCRFGAALLIGLLLLGIFSNFLARRRYDSLSREMAQAEQLALAQDLTGAADAARRCCASWNRYRTITAALVDHQQLSRIDTLFRQLEFAQEQGDLRVFGDLCAQLCQELQSMAREHSLSWENIL